ncbi:MAG: hypothetical protein HY303_00455 [Candidatus Wallbacteria bacterium]|nr:hypothetical protein [Candidatus Wallbacteria bacterium]
MMSREVRLFLVLVCVAVTFGTASAGTLFKPAMFDDDTKVPATTSTLSVFWPNLDDKVANKPPVIHTLGQASGQFANEFGPATDDRKGEKPIAHDPDTNNPGHTKLGVAESQEGLSGQPIAGLKNSDKAMPVMYRVYTIAAPVDASIYDENVNKIVETFDNTDPKKNEQIKVGYEWSIVPAAAADKLGTFEFAQTHADLLQADQLGTVDGGKKLADTLGGHAWLPFMPSNTSTGPPVDNPPFNGFPLKGQLKDKQHVPDFSFTASTPGDYQVKFRMAVVRNDGSAAGKPDAAESGEVAKRIEVANLTPPMMMTGAAPGPVFSTTGDPLDNEAGTRTPAFSQDDLYTVIWVMSNAHSGQTVDPNKADHVSKIEVTYPKFVQPAGSTLAFMPEQDQDLKVDPITGEIQGTHIYNGGDTFGMTPPAGGTGMGGGTPELGGPGANPTIDGWPGRASMGVADQFCPKMTAAASKAKSMQEFASGTWQDPKLTKDILASTPGKDGLVGTIQLPSNFPMPECQSATLSAFKVKVPIEHAPYNFEGKIPWVVSAKANGNNEPAGQLEGSLSVIDNKPPDVTLAMQNPKTGATRILQIANAGGGEHTLAPEPFSTRKGELAAGDTPVSTKATSDQLSPTAPVQEQMAFPNEQTMKTLGIVKSDGSDDVIQLPDSYALLKGAVTEAITLPGDIMPADEDVRLTVSIFPTDNVSTWDELYLKIYSEEALAASPDNATPVFEGTMAKFKAEKDGRFTSNARTTSDKHDSRMRVEIYDFDPAKVPYKGPSLNPKFGGKPTVRLFANCRKIIIPVARGGVNMEMHPIQNENQKGAN